MGTLASLAAGMDYPNVRSVYLMNIPESVEQFWQALGRAGRDGKRASVYLFASLNDTAKALAESTHPSSTRIVLRSFGVSVSCRLRETLDYIDGINSTTKCGHCDLCAEFSSYDAHEQANVLLKSFQYPIGSPQPLTSATKSFDEEIFRAALEKGFLRVDCDQKNTEKLFISVSDDDATQLRLRASCTKPLLIYRPASATPKRKKQRLA